MGGLVPLLNALSSQLDLVSTCAQFIECTDVFTLGVLRCRRPDH